MKIRLLAITAALALACGALWHYAAKPSDKTGATASIAGKLPTEAEARDILNATTQHREWVNLAISNVSGGNGCVYSSRIRDVPITLR